MPDIVSEQAASAGNKAGGTEATGSDLNPNQNKNSDIPLVFLREAELFGSRKPDRSEWVQHVELYKAIGLRIEASHISGLQRVRGMWRIYLDNLHDKVKLMAEGIPLRGKTLPVLNTNPDRLDGENTTRIRIKNVPLSADDNIIKRVITLTGADVISNFREKLRVDNKLTNCETGDRIVIVKTSSLKEPLPNFKTFGNFTGRVYHVGQSKQTTSKPLKCSKCLQDGHTFPNCQNNWVCTICNESGHKRAECPGEKSELDETDSSESEPSDEESESDQSVSQTQSMIEKPKKSPVKTDRRERRKVKPSKIRQQSIDKFVTPAKLVQNVNKTDRSPPTPAEELHDSLNLEAKKKKKQNAKNKE